MKPPVTCYRVRGWQRRADTICRKLDDLLTDIRAEMSPTTGIELSITNQLSRLVDETDLLVANIDALACEVSR